MRGEGAAARRRARAAGGRERAAGRGGGGSGRRACGSPWARGRRRPCGRHKWGRAAQLQARRANALPNTAGEGGWENKGRGHGKRCGSVQMLLDLVKMGEVSWWVI